MPVTTIRIIDTPAEIQEVYRFRYKVYVEEMGRNPHHANHELKQLRHSLDATGVNIAAFDAATIIGVIRNNLGPDGSFGQFSEFYGISNGIYNHPQQTSITSGLMVESSRRRGIIGARLAVAAYEYGLSRGIRWNFIDCIPSLADFFKSFGWIEHLPEAVHPEYPFSVCRLRLDLQDEDHLESVRSPFLASYRNHKERQIIHQVPHAVPTDLQEIDS